MKQVYLQLGICYRNLIQVDEYLEEFRQADGVQGFFLRRGTLRS